MVNARWLQNPLCSVCLQRWACSARLRSQKRCCCESFATPTSSMRSSSMKTTSAPPTTTSTRGASPSTTSSSSCRYAAFQGTRRLMCDFWVMGCLLALARKSCFFTLPGDVFFFFWINLLSAVHCRLPHRIYSFNPTFTRLLHALCLVNHGDSFAFCFVLPRRSSLEHDNSYKFIPESSSFFFFLFFLLGPNAVFIRTSHWVVTETGS